MGFFLGVIIFFFFVYFVLFSLFEHWMLCLPGCQASRMCIDSYVAVHGGEVLAVRQQQR